MSIPHKVKPRSRTVRKKPLPGAVTPRVKLWLEANGESVFCRGLADMLKGVERTESIKGAAKEVGRSYRYVWARIKEAEAALGATLVTAHIGGSGSQRSELTPLARELLHDFDQLRADVFRLVDRVFARRLAATLARHRVRP
jgi:molybdate transport repressor ModE-like protein